MALIQVTDIARTYQQGSHEVLLAQGGRYAQLWQRQQAEEE